MVVEKVDLQNIVAQFEDDRVLHSIVFDEEIHAFCTAFINKGPLDLSFESLRHVFLKILEQVNLAFDVFRELIADSIVPATIASTFATNVVKMTVVTL